MKSAVIAPLRDFGAWFASCFQPTTGMWRGLSFVLISVVACATEPVRPPPPDALYLAVEVMQHGKRIGAPKLLGFAGHKVTAERHTPGSSDPDYRLVLSPHEAGSGYRLALELTLPDGAKSGDVQLLHGEERRVPLGNDTELKVLLMRVDSDEFRALMAVPEPKLRGQI
jgi:hypothetical protein